MIKLKRVYQQPSKEDGFRILVERLWPRGITKEKAAIDLWLKNIAPSTELRKWFNHEASKWKVFKERYWEELRRNKEAIALIKCYARKDDVTFVFAARDEKRNSAVVLKEFIV